MITPNMLQWRAYRYGDDPKHVFGRIEVRAVDPKDGASRTYTYCIATDYVLMSDPYGYFWYTLKNMTHALCQEYINAERMKDFEWYKRNSSMFA